MTADRFLIIDKGRVLKEISKNELDLECKRCIAVKTSDTKMAVTVIEKSGITDYKVIDGTEIRIYHENVDPEEINKLLIKNNIGVSSVYETGITLEDYFKTLVGEEK